MLADALDSCGAQTSSVSVQPARACACATAVASSYEECTDKWESLEDDDEAEAERRQRMNDARRRMLKRVDSRAGKLVGARAINRSNSHFNLDASDWYSGSHDADLRNGFLRKVYGILALQVLLTASVVAVVRVRPRVTFA